MTRKIEQYGFLLGRGRLSYLPALGRVGSALFGSHHGCNKIFLTCVLPPAPRPVGRDPKGSMEATALLEQLRSSTSHNTLSSIIARTGHRFQVALRSSSRAGYTDPRVAS